MNTILRIFNLIIIIIIITYSRILFYVKYCWDAISSPMHATRYILLYSHKCSKVNPFINLLGKTFWILRVCSKRYQTTNCGMVGDLAVHSVGRSRSLQFLIFRLCWEAPFFPVLVPIPSLSVPTFFSHSDLKLFNPYRTNVENRVSS